MSLTPEQIEKRRHGIGATDVSAILGENPWKNAFDVFLDKVEPPGGDTEPSAAMEAGNILEPSVLEWYRRQHPGAELRPTRTIEHPLHPFCIATPDALAAFDPGDFRLVEAKTTGIVGRGSQLEWGEPGTDEVPRAYLIQCHWQLFVGLALDSITQCDLAVLRGGYGFSEYVIQPDQEYEGLLFEAVGRFWKDHVLARKPPEEVGPSESHRKALDRLYKTHNENMLEATAETRQIIEQDYWARRSAKVADNSAAELDNQLRLIIGESAGLRGDWGKLYWKCNKDSETVDWKAVAEELKAPLAIIAKHRGIRPGSRVFRTYYHDDWFEDRKEQVND